MAHRADGLNDIFEHNVIVRESLNTNSGTIAHIPADNKDIVNKEYVDSFVSGSFVPYTGATQNIELSNKEILITKSSTTATYSGDSIDSSDINWPGYTTEFRLFDFDTGGLGAFSNDGAGTTGHFKVQPNYIEFYTSTGGGTVQSFFQFTTNSFAVKRNTGVSGAGAILTLEDGYTDGANPFYHVGEIVYQGLKNRFEFDKTIFVSGAGLIVSGVVSGANITSMNNDIASLSGAYYTHASDSSDPHGATLTQTGIISSGTISGAIIRITGDKTISGSAYVSNTIYGTNATPPTASNFEIGSIYFQYTP